MIDWSTEKHRPEMHRLLLTEQAVFTGDTETLNLLEESKSIPTGYSYALLPPVSKYLTPHILVEKFTNIMDVVLEEKGCLDTPVTDAFSKVLADGFQLLDSQASADLEEYLDYHFDIQENADIVLTRFRSHWGYKTVEAKMNVDPMVLRVYQEMITKTVLLIGFIDAPINDDTFFGAVSEENIEEHWLKYWDNYLQLTELAATLGAVTL